MKKGIALTLLIIFVLIGLGLEDISKVAGIQLSCSSSSDMEYEVIIWEEDNEQESCVSIFPAHLPAVFSSVFSLQSRHFCRRDEDCSPKSFLDLYHPLRAPPAV